MFADFQNYLSDAIDAVLTSEVQEESFAQAVQAQACLMAGVNRDEISDFYPEFA